MVVTTGLSTTARESNSMEENWLWYLAGAFDSDGTMRVNIKEDDRLKIGYYIEPVLVYSQPSEVDSVFGLIDEYAEDIGARIRILDRGSNIRAETEDAESISRFLEGILPGMIQQRERAEFFIETVLPEFEEGRPETKEEFIEFMEIVDELEEYPISGRKRKYDVEFFRDEWGLE